MAGLWDTLKKLLTGQPVSVTVQVQTGANPNSSTGTGASAPNASPQATGASAGAGPYRAPQAPAASAAPYRTPPNPLDASGLLSLSKDELRAKALKIDPYKTAWIGRVDTIPPLSDERTALIDRGLILRGLLTPADVEEIHRVGDQWIAHREAWRFAQLAAQSAGAVAVDALRAERARKRAEKRAEAAARREARTREVARRRATDVYFAGRGVSAGLADRRANPEKLAALGLPLLATPGDLASALKLPVPKLRWLCFHSEAAERTHYVQFTVPKRSGGVRTLSAPHRTLRAAQGWVLREVLAKLPSEPSAHGFLAGRSVVTNAREHVGRALVVNLDLADFFPSITFPRVRGLFEALGYSPAVATLLALLCTECPRKTVRYEGRAYHVAVGPRALPQGACTSPALSNQVSRKLDRRLAGWCGKHGWTYTRYADDLTFSRAPGDAGGAARGLPALYGTVRAVVTAEGFALNPKKGRVQRRGKRQAVTGVVVNDKLGVPRDELRRLRALVHQVRYAGLEAQNRTGRPHFEAWLRGKIAYVQMVDRAKGDALLRTLEANLAASRAGAAP